MGKKKKGAAPVVKAAPVRADVAVLTPQQKAAATRAARKREADTLAKANAQRLAQVVNLHIGGYSLEEIGLSIGASAEEVDRMLNRDMSRYVRNQPALRVFVRNYVSEKYTKMLDAVWEEATDKNAPKKLENQDRAMRILDGMRKLHGADAPTQTEIKVESAPEAVEALVRKLADSQGLGYDTNIFDVEVVDVTEEVHHAVEEAESALADASERVGEDDENDEEWEQDDE